MLGALNSQGDLFTVPEPARARNTDPATSHEAAARITGDGLSDARRLALNLVRLYPGRTTKELGAIAAQDFGGEVEARRQQVGRRLSELHRDGLIQRGPVRDGCHTWRAV